MTEVKVRKKDGSEEPLQLSKIEGAVKKAGGSVALAAETALEVGVWAKERAKQGVITTIELQKQVVNFVATKNSQVATAMQNFVKKAAEAKPQMPAVRIEEKPKEALGAVAKAEERVAGAVQQIVSKAAELKPSAPGTGAEKKPEGKEEESSEEKQESASEEKTE